MATRVTPAQLRTTTGQNTDMERAIAVSRSTVGSERLYSSIVTTAARGRTRIHHHGECETSIYIVSGSARYTWGPTGVEHEMGAGAGDFVYIPAGEIHVEENASSEEPLVVVLSRNCPDSHVVYVDGGPDGSGDVPAPC
ncbi:MAG: cupin domain-containing protein [Chloroflexi bacterium]|nr:MAG: cupin domain-containing protein [Chloroflexota bacterium]